jgi:hypothetical protein
LKICVNVSQSEVGILEDGMKFHPIGIPLNEAQFLETRKYSTNEICRLFKVPPHLVGDLEKATFSNIVLGKGKHSRPIGELANALGVSGARMDKSGTWNVKIGFSEPRRDGKSNAMIANVLENGKHNQPPRPFLKTAKSAAKAECISAMVSKLNEELDKL